MSSYPMVQYRPTIDPESPFCVNLTNPKQGGVSYYMTQGEVQQLVIACCKALSEANPPILARIQDLTAAEPFCACGRVVSECDGSRAKCVKRKPTPPAGKGE